ncbi:hypothetical protein O181_095524 [Austropuccinia psidii MF-1]|uniref:Integrase catalytic domain-containing protein n=1 Tax=Austropuccinia psidii MF-1 TaxID=1389203 RepID=A0A9Q3J5A7_9BASI|nr:hypothetical protein [Austropuccinia psidii MF-1]
MNVKYLILQAFILKINPHHWHQRLGHPGPGVLKSMGLMSNTFNCRTCDLNKAHVLPFKGNFEHVYLTLDCVYLDLVGPITPPLVSGYQYFLTIIDQFTLFKITCFIKNKANAFNKFLHKRISMENLNDRTLKKLVSDRGGEFLNHKFKTLSEKCRLQHVFSPAETNKNNVFAEREKVQTAMILCNIVPTPSRIYCSPLSLWRGTPLQSKKIHIFGCQAIISLQEGHREWKFGPTRNKGVLLGFENNNTSYCILRILDKKVAKTRHATFNENLFPKVSGDIGELIVDWNSNCWPATVVDETHIGASAPVDELQADEQLEDTSRVVDEVHVPHEEPRIKIIGPQHPTHITRNILEQNILPYYRQANALLITSSNDPKTFRQALLSPKKEAWKEAINKELKSTASLNVWEVIDLDPAYRLIGTVWVFKPKCSHLGNIIEHKACLCAQVFTQTAGIDYNKTYFPTRRFNSLQTLIALAATTSLPFHQIEIERTFLNASLNETFYLLVPQGLDLAREKYCLHLQKAIYGLKQAPLTWYDSLKSWLASSEFVACVLDPCISKEFDIKDIGPADLMLGVKVTHLPNRIGLDQQHFSNSLLFLYGMQECRPVSTPLSPNNHYLPATEEEALEFKKLAFLENPGVTHWHGFLHILRYLRDSPDMWLLYSKRPSQGIIAYRNADRGNCHVSPQSVLGYVATLNGCLMLWKTRKQPPVSLSTAEAEYKVLCDLTSELLSLCQ